MIYATKNLVKYNFGHLFKQILADIAATVLISLPVSGITLQDVSYLGWFFMAAKVSLIAAVCIAVIICIFYPREMRALVKRLSVKLLRK
jgi:hypothetical protein